jgi:HEPN domain-containing protein
MTEMSDKKKLLSMAESFLERAGHKLDEAREHLKMFHYAESISSSQECIELSIKAIFLLSQEEYPKKHEFDEEEFERVLSRIPRSLEYLEFHKVYLYSKFWLQFYTVAKYGLEKLGVGADKLFEKEEAELAIKHAERCRYVAQRLFYEVKYEVSS